MERLSSLAECKTNRETIELNGHWINNIDNFLDEGDEGYAEQQASLSDALGKAEQAVHDKPKECGLEEDGWGHFTCTKCRFEFEVD